MCRSAAHSAAVAAAAGGGCAALRCTCLQIKPKQWCSGAGSRSRSFSCLNKGCRCSTAEVGDASCMLGHMHMGRLAPQHNEVQRCACSVVSREALPLTREAAQAHHRGRRRLLLRQELLLQHRSMQPAMHQCPMCATSKCMGGCDLREGSPVVSCCYLHAQQRVVLRVIVIVANTAQHLAPEHRVCCLLCSSGCTPCNSSENQACFLLCLHPGLQTEQAMHTLRA